MHEWEEQVKSDHYLANCPLIPGPDATERDMQVYKQECARVEYFSFMLHSSWLLHTRTI